MQLEAGRGTVTAQTLRDRQGVTDGDGEGWPRCKAAIRTETVHQAMEVLLLTADSCQGCPSQKAAPLTAWVTPEDRDTSPLLHIGKLTTGAEHGAGADVPVWKRSQKGTPSILEARHRDVTAAWLIMADRTKQTRQWLESIKLLNKRDWLGKLCSMHLMKYYIAITNLVVRDYPLYGEMFTKYN